MRLGSPGRRKERRRRNVSEASTLSVSSANSSSIGKLLKKNNLVKMFIIVNISSKNQNRVKIMLISSLPNLSKFFFIQISKLPL